MSQAYFWNTVEDGAFLLIVFGLFGALQIFLSYTGAYIYFIVSPILLAMVPLGVVLAQATATAVLANFFAVRIFPYRPRRGVPEPSPLRQYLRRFGIFLLAFLVILIIWAGFYVLIFFYSPWAQLAYLVGYIIANTAGALIALSLAVLFDWLFRT
ncbi:MAG: hypothetical protein ACFE89_11585 [Candidatus Hodarchaeota archaeon]